MYITNLKHFLDNSGNIPGQLPKETREYASFFALMVDATTKEPSSGLVLTDLRCFKKECSGMIKSEIYGKNFEIHWKCSKCQNEGKLIGWHKTKWDNRKLHNLTVVEEDCQVK